MLTEQAKRCPSCGTEVRFHRNIPLTTEAASKLLVDVFGGDPMLDGNLLKMLRAVERAHGIGLMWRGEG